MKQVTATAAKNRFGDVLHSVVYGREAHVVTRNGRNMAVMLDIETFNSLILGEGTELDVVS